MTGPSSMSNFDPLIEPRIILLLGQYLLNRGSSVYCRVKGVAAPNFDTDVDLLEVRDGDSVAYEIKGMRVRGRGEKKLTGPTILEGAGQALSHLAVADYSYLVHPETMFRGYLLRSLLIARLLPIGYVIATSEGRFVEIKAAERSPIDVGAALGRKRIVEVEKELASVGVWKIERELRDRLERYKNLPLDLDEEDRSAVRQLLEAANPL